MAAVEIHESPASVEGRAAAQPPPGPGSGGPARDGGAAYLGRRQEVGPESGSGRLEGEHGAAALASGPRRGPAAVLTPADASGPSAPGATAQVPSAAGPAGRTDGRGHSKAPARAGRSRGRAGPTRTPGPIPGRGPAPRLARRPVQGRPPAAPKPLGRVGTGTKRIEPSATAGPQTGHWGEWSLAAILRTRPAVGVPTAARRGHGGTQGSRRHAGVNDGGSRG
jgi:hypothetical protein